MALIPSQNISQEGLLPYLYPVSPSGDTVENVRGLFLYVTNSVLASQRTLTITTQKTVTSKKGFGRLVKNNAVVVIPAGATRLVGPFPECFNKLDALIELSLDNPQGVLLAALKLRDYPNEVDPPVFTSIQSLTSGSWSGSYATINMTAAYQRISMVTTTIGNLPEGVVDNNDGSFTNVSGETLTIVGEHEVMGYVEGESTLITAGSDNAGDDAIIDNSGAWYPFEGVMDGALCWVAEYSIDLLDGKSVFPMIKNNSGEDPFYLGTLTHKIWSRAQ